MPLRDTFSSADNRDGEERRKTSGEKNDPFKVEPEWADAWSGKKKIPFEEESEVIVDNLNQNQETSINREIHYVVHPGFLVNENNPFDRPHIGDENLEEIGFTGDNYEKYVDSLNQQINNTSTPVVVLESHDQRGISEDILNDNFDPMTYLETRSGKGDMKDSEDRRKLASQVSGLEPGSKVTVHGEYKGRCHDRFKRLLENIERKSDLEYNVVEGEVFPAESLP